MSENVSAVELVGFTGPAMRRARKLAGLNQRELGRRLIEMGVLKPRANPSSTVSRWEVGEARPALDSLAAFIDATGQTWASFHMLMEEAAQRARQEEHVHSLRATGLAADELNQLMRAAEVNAESVIAGALADLVERVKGRESDADGDEGQSESGSRNSGKNQR